MATGLTGIVNQAKLPGLIFCALLHLYIVTLGVQLLRSLSQGRTDRKLYHAALDGLGQVHVRTGQARRPGQQAPRVGLAQGHHRRAEHPQKGKHHRRCPGSQDQVHGSLEQTGAKPRLQRTPHLRRIWTIHSGRMRLAIEHHPFPDAALNL